MKKVIIILLVLCVSLSANFIQKWYIPQGTSGPAGRVVIDDTDRDGNYEFFICRTGGSQKIYVYELHLPNTWEVDSFSYFWGPLVWDSGDFDLDGLHDLVIQTAVDTPPQTLISVAESPDSFSYPTQEVWRDTVGQPAVAPISVYDIDQDGFPEIIDNNGSGQPHWIWVYESTGNNQYDTVCTFNPMTDTFPQSSVSTHAFGDFDGDGNIEFVMGDLSAGSFGADYWVFESPANNTYEQIFQGYVQTKNIKDCFSVADADGDGKLEFVVKGFVIPSAEIHAFIFEAVADNTYEIIKTFTLSGGDYYGGYSAAGDVDGDSIPEIVLEARQNVFIIKAAGNDSFYIWDTLPGHASGSCVRIFDIDENGLAEIIISGNDETRIYEYDPGGIEEARSKIQEARLKVYPNPFSKMTKISFGKGHGAMGMELKIYDVSGRMIKQFDYPTIRQSDQITWYGDDECGRVVAQGIYFIRVENVDAGETVCKKVLKVK